MVCNKEEGFGEDDFVVEFLGEVCYFCIIAVIIVIISPSFAL